MYFNRILTDSQKIERKIASETKMENQLGSARLPIFKKYVLKRQSRKPSKNELNAEQIKCKGLGRNFDHAPRAGRELTAGGSRTQASIADYLQNLSAIFKEKIPFLKKEKDFLSLRRQRVQPSQDCRRTYRPRRAGAVQPGTARVRPPEASWP